MIQAEDITNMEPLIHSEYERVCVSVRQKLQEMPFCIIAIGGYMHVGKTSLSRYLSCKLNISLVEMDLFLLKNDNGVSYDYSYIRYILNAKKKSQRHIIIEGIAVLPTLNGFDTSEIFLVYVKRKCVVRQLVDESWFDLNTEVYSVAKILDFDSQSDLEKNADLVVVI